MDLIKLYKLIIIIGTFFGFVVISTANFSIPVKGDVAPQPISPSGLGSGEGKNYSTYLKNVYVSMDLYKNISYGHGEYFLYNPSKKSENITLFFNPGHKPNNCTITVDGAEVDTWKDEIEITSAHPYEYYSYPVMFFNVSSEANSETKIDINWNTLSYRNEYSTYLPHDNSSETYRYKCKTTWDISYLIISKSGWNEPIEEVSITFDIHCQEFYNYTKRLNSSSSRTITDNSEGYNTIKYNLQDYWEKDGVIKIGHDMITSRVTEYYYPKFNHSQIEHVKNKERFNVSTKFELIPHQDYKIDEVFLYYKKKEDTKYFKERMVKYNNSFSTTLLAPDHETILEYYIWANDTFKCKNKTRSFNIVVGDPPCIDHLQRSQSSPSKTMTINTTITDNSNLSSVELFYRRKGQTNFTTVQMETSGEDYTADIPAIDGPGTIEYYIQATDIYGNENRTDVHEVEVEGSDDDGVSPEQRKVGISISILLILITLGVLIYFVTTKDKKKS